MRRASKDDIIYNSLVHLMVGEALTIRQSVLEEHVFEIWRTLERFFLLLAPTMRMQPMWRVWCSGHSRHLEFQTHLSKFCLAQEPRSGAVESSCV